jgi:hypothetical protein
MPDGCGPFGSCIRLHVSLSAFPCILALQLLLRFIEQPSCVILAVSAANQDLANSDALQMARRVCADFAIDPTGTAAQRSAAQRSAVQCSAVQAVAGWTDSYVRARGQVDPEGRRTIGIITKATLARRHPERMLLVVTCHRMLGVLVHAK